MVAPTVYGGNRLSHRNRGVTQFTVGADSISARFVSVKPFATADRRGRRSLQCMVVTVRSTEAVEIAQIIGRGGGSPPVLFWLNCLFTADDQWSPLQVWR